MKNLRALVPAIVVALLPLFGVRSWSLEKPQFTPSRDVDIVYEVVRDGRVVRERVRWLASDHLERIDGSGSSATIVDEKANEVTFLNSASATYSQVEGASPWPIAPPENPAAVRSRGESVVAGLRCTDWSWTDDVEARIACLTADGVLMRLTVDGKVSIEARSVSYRPQDAEIFQIPPGYAPAVMAPEMRRLVR